MWILLAEVAADIAAPVAITGGASGILFAIYGLMKRISEIESDVKTYVQSTVLQRKRQQDHWALEEAHLATLTEIANKLIRMDRLEALELKLAAAADMLYTRARAAERADADTDRFSVLP